MNRHIAYVLIVAAAVGAYCEAASHATINTRVGPSGGQGGIPFSDSAPLGWKLVELRIWSGDHIDAIQMVHRSPFGLQQTSPKRGGSGGHLRTFKLGPAEYINAVAGRYGDYVDSLVVFTNTARTARWGGPGGAVAFKYEMTPGSRVRGFFGKAGGYVDNLGVLVETLDQLPGGMGPDEDQVDRPGFDIGSPLQFKFVGSTSGARHFINCRDTCAWDRRCKAWTFVKPQKPGDDPVCWLKNWIPHAKTDSCCVSGRKLLP